jgi:hypothetical protein
VAAFSWVWCAGKKQIFNKSIFFILSTRCAR